MTYPGLPAPVIGDHLTREASRAHYAPGTEFHIGRIEMVANTGTYLDAPFHRFADGADLAGCRSSRSPTCPARSSTSPARARGSDRPRSPAATSAGCAVLFQTGWTRHFGTPALRRGTPVRDRRGRRAVRRGRALVGIDSLNIDDTERRSAPRPHRSSRRRIPIVEHLANLGALPTTGFRFSPCR